MYMYTGSYAYWCFELVMRFDLYVNDTHICFFLQLIYDFRDGGGSFGLLTLHPDQLSEEDRQKFTRIGFQLHSSK